MARPKKYVVTLTEEERKKLKELVSKGNQPVRVVRRAQMLLAADAGEANTSIGRTLHVHPNTVTNVCKRFVEAGLEAALYERSRPGKPPKLDAKGEATLIALACSEPPEGRACWTMYLLAERLVELGVVEAISDETVRRVLKKTALSPGKSSTGVSAS